MSWFGQLVHYYVTCKPYGDPPEHGWEDVEYACETCGQVWVVAWQNDFEEYTTIQRVGAGYPVWVRKEV